MYLVRRLLQSLVVLWVISTLLFVLLRVSGDPAKLLLGAEATPEQLQRVREELGLDDPLLVQYGRFIKDLVALEFGESFHLHRPVRDLIQERLGRTVVLGLAAAVIAVGVGIPLGVSAALGRGRLSGLIASTVALVGQSVPNFFLALILISYFAVRLRWLPSFGAATWVHLILPATALSGRLLAQVVRLVRAELLEVLGKAYIRTARAKGLVEWLVVYRHALRNALLPTVTVIGMDVGKLLSGTVIIETIFSWPGMGSLLIDGVLRRDYPVVHGTVFILTTIVVLSSFLVDVVYQWLDPRIRYR